MLTLYYKPSCAYSQEVLGEAEDLGVKFNLKDIASDPALAEELVIQGGTQRTPFLIDPDRGVKMYESALIVGYLKEFYKDGSSMGTFGGLRIHRGEDVCDSCQ